MSTYANLDFMIQSSCSRGIGLSMFEGCKLFVVFSCRDSIEPITSGVCDVCVGVGLVCCRWFLLLLVGMQFHCLRF